MIWAIFGIGYYWFIILYLVILGNIWKLVFDHAENPHISLNRYGAVVPKLRRWKQLENKHLFPQEVYKAEAWKLESLAEVGKLESDNKQTKNWSVKIGTCQQKLENWNLKSRSVKVGICQQKFEKFYAKIKSE